MKDSPFFLELGQRRPGHRYGSVAKDSVSQKETVMKDVGAYETTIQRLAFGHSNAAWLPSDRVDHFRVLSPSPESQFHWLRLFSFEVTNPLDILALISFLTTGLVIARLTTRVREGELVARLRAVSRRLGRDDISEPMLLQAGDLELHINRRQLYQQGNMVHLTPTEFELLALLMRNQGIPVTHAKLLRSIWGPEYGTELDYLRSFVKTLRQKVEADTANPKYIVTVPWVGYRFCNPLDEPQDASRDGSH
jgi:DNA-binding winged helix-turn-helix (wHTH) protein